jgi:hypothetical protein
MEETHKEKIFKSIAHDDFLSHSTRIEAAKVYGMELRHRTGQIIDPVIEALKSSAKINYEQDIDDPRDETYEPSNETVEEEPPEEYEETTNEEKVVYKEETEKEINAPFPSESKGEEKNSIVVKSLNLRAAPISGDTHEERVERSLLAACHNPRNTKQGRLHSAKTLADLQFKRFGYTFDPKEEAKIGDLKAKELGIIEYHSRKRPLLKPT